MGQGYRLGVDARFQTVGYRGWSLDSIPASDVVDSPSGRPATPDGFAVRCLPGAEFCTFHRPGRELRGLPLVATARLAAWGIGLPGLSFRGVARLSADASSPDVWPGTAPPLQLLEGYAEYARPELTGQLGRVRETNRFGFVGFDGARAVFRLLRQRLGITAYGGWGLARGVDLPVTSPELNPLDDFQPSQRQGLFGAAVGWSSPGVAVKTLYQREVDTRTEDLVSERTGLELALTGRRGFRLSGGFDYDIAAGFLGSAEAELAYEAPNGIGSGTVGWRRYRPHFDLWDIWVAFSPVPYNALYGRLSVVPVRGLELQALGERFEFENSEAESPLVTTPDYGWNWLLRGIYGWKAWRIMAGLNREFGPGASSLGYEGRIDVTPVPTLTAAVHASYMKRPLEYRFDESHVFTGGLSARWSPVPDLTFTSDLTYWDESRERPDAAAFEWDQLRFQIGATIALASPLAARGVPPAVLRMPSLFDEGASR